MVIKKPKNRKEARPQILSKLGNIVELGVEISEIMDTVMKKQNRFNDSLRSGRRKSGRYMFVSWQRGAFGFDSRYNNEKGDNYGVRFYKL